ncbi:MAG: hypothetical protein GC178_00700 [Flavobacteriales bacterium]|nr:hypothetical protein [Flavobacteriales bacterium]
MQEVAPYRPKNKIRIVTAASLFDGHDAAINIMRRIIQSTGCEVIPLLLRERVARLGATPKPCGGSRSLGTTLFCVVARWAKW